MASDRILRYVPAVARWAGLVTLSIGLAAAQIPAFVAGSENGYAPGKKWFE